jgi:hypothetical protein
LLSLESGFLSFSTTIFQQQRQLEIFFAKRSLWTLLYLVFDLLSCKSLTMSSSITIPTRSGYGESSKAGAAPSSSSSSSYSSSPQTPQQPQEKSTPSSPNTRYGHDRRPSLLSEFSSPLPVPWDCEMIRVAPLMAACTDRST